MFRVSQARRTREAVLPPLLPRVWMHFLRPAEGSAVPEGEVSAGRPPPGLGAEGVRCAGSRRRFTSPCSAALRTLR